MSNYKAKPEAIVSARNIIGLKIARREFLLQKYGLSSPKTYGGSQENIQQVLLYEARAAKYFWKKFSLLLPAWCQFPGRKKRSGDMVNTLLDVGYHNLTYALMAIFKKYDLAPVLGIFHAAHQSDGAPLAYDLIEMFRADIVELQVLKFLRQKKRLIIKLGQKDIGMFLSDIKHRLERKY